MRSSFEIQCWKTCYAIASRCDASVANRHWFMSFGAFLSLARWLAYPFRRATAPHSFLSLSLNALRFIYFYWVFPFHKWLQINYYHNNVIAYFSSCFCYSEPTFKRPRKNLNIATYSLWLQTEPKFMFMETLYVIRLCRESLVCQICFRLAKHLCISTTTRFFLYRKCYIGSTVRLKKILCAFWLCTFLL